MEVANQAWPITSFQGEYRFLSNFWPCKVSDELEIEYDSVEHAYQAGKSTSLRERLRIQQCNSAGVAKRMGRKLIIRDDWDDMKLNLMENLVREKFERSKRLADTLLATGDAELVEGNGWGDQFWGVSGGKGHNHLGKILMQVRASLAPTIDEIGG
jgi:ribA/ribD-fused uncharacterized protein